MNHGDGDGDNDNMESDGDVDAVIPSECPDVNCDDSVPDEPSAKLLQLFNGRVRILKKNAYDIFSTAVTR
jgi:hypothetical protein